MFLADHCVTYLWRHKPSKAVRKFDKLSRLPKLVLWFLFYVAWSWMWNIYQDFYYQAETRLICGATKHQKDVLYSFHKRDPVMQKWGWEFPAPPYRRPDESWFGEDHQLPFRN